jgi:hypothetical protein
VLALNVPLRQSLRGVPEEAMRRARRAGAEAAARYGHADGHVRFTGHGYYATASRSAH